MARAARALALALIVVAGGLGACGGDDPTVVLVTIAARPTMRPFDTVDVLVENGGGSASQTFTVPSGRVVPLTFTVTPEGRTGDLAVKVTARIAGGEMRGQGHTIVAIAPGRAVNAQVMLEPHDFLVNEQIVRTQWLSVNEDQAGRQIGVAPDGSFLITWENDCPLSRCDILGRRFDAKSAPATNLTTMNAGDFIVNQASEYTESPTITAGPGGYLVAWLFGPDVNLVQKDLKATVLGFDGGHKGLDLTISAAAENDFAPIAIARADGTYVLFWTRLRVAPAVGSEVRGQVLDASGGKLFGEFAVSASTTADMGMPHAAALPGGAFVVVWASSEGGATNVRARVFGSSGAPATAADVNVTTYPAGIAYGPRVAPTTDGFIVAWQAFAASPPSLSDSPMFARRFTGNGTPAAPELVIAPKTLNLRSQPIMAARGDGALGVVWQDCGDLGDVATSCGIRFRLLHPSGLPVGDATVVNTTTQGDQFAPSIAPLGGDAFVVAWTDNSMLPPDTDGSGVRARVIYPSVVRTDGVLGARCDESGAAPCGAGLVCAAAADQTRLCHPACTSACPLGGTCTDGTYCAF